MGGKLGIDATASNDALTAPQTLLSDEALLDNLQMICSNISAVQQYMRHTKNPITVIAVNGKDTPPKECFNALQALQEYLRIIVFVDTKNNDIANAYMLVWRVVNNIDANRDIFVHDLMVGIDATTKTSVDDFTREWPDDVTCTPSVIESLKQRGLWTLDDASCKKFAI